jgi:hypothetical protein
MTEQRRLRLVDRYQIITTVLFVVVGVAILIRSMTLGARTDSYGLGAVFLLYGLYRLRLIVRALWRGRQTP